MRGHQGSPALRLDANCNNRFPLGAETETTENDQMNCVERLPYRPHMALFFVSGNLDGSNRQQGFADIIIQNLGDLLSRRCIRTEEILADEFAVKDAGE
jgi:hypothetical protein